MSDDKNIRDAHGFYHLLDTEQSTMAATKPVLRFDRGTLLLEGIKVLPDGSESHFVYDARVDAYRAPALCYPQIISSLRGLLSRNSAPRYGRLNLTAALDIEPYPHQQDALSLWQQARGQGVIVLPTGAGKTLVGLLAMCWARRDSLILVPTIDLMHQWYALLRAAFPDQELGLLGGGYHEILPLTVATYDSASRHADRLGNRFGLLVFDEVHHLPSEFYRCIAEFSLAPYRLGLTATPERSDGKEADLVDLIGATLYRRRPEELAGDVLAPFQIRTLPVDLSQAERDDYQQALAVRNQFLDANRISLGSLQGWNRFVMASAKSSEGRRAMQAHQQARRIAQATPAKLRTLAAILTNHQQAKAIVFTEDNATAYEISQRFLIPCMTHQTKVKERQLILERLREGVYRAVVTSKVLNEGVDMPDVSIGIILSGSASGREFIQRLGRILRRSENKQAILYEIIARDTREERVAERRHEALARGQSTGVTKPLFDE